MNIKPGSLVQHTVEHCRSIGWWNPPINGIVIKIDGQFADVVWCNSTDAPTRIALGNIELHSSEPISESFRNCLKQEFNIK